MSLWPTAVGQAAGESGLSSRPLVALDSVCETRTGTRDPGKAPGQRFWYVDIASVDNRVKRINGAKQLLGEEAPSRARRIIRTGDVIVSMTRPNLNAVALVPESFDNQICSTGFGVLRPKASLLSEYLFYFVTNPAFVSIASGAVSGAMYPAITESFLRSITIPLPPLDEQRRIVDMLNHAASIRRLCAHAKAKAKELIPALFLDMFGDPATNPKGWEIATIGSVIEGAQYGTSKKAHENGHGLPVLRMGNVTYEGDLDLTDLKYVELDGSELAKVSLRNGDILFNRTNSKDLVGKTGLWDGRFDAVAAS